MYNGGLTRGLGVEGEQNDLYRTYTKRRELINPHKIKKVRHSKLI